MHADYFFRTRTLYTLCVATAAACDGGYVEETADFSRWQLLADLQQRRSDISVVPGADRRGADRLRGR